MEVILRVIVIVSFFNGCWSCLDDWASSFNSMYLGLVCFVALQRGGLVAQGYSPERMWHLDWKVCHYSSYLMPEAS